jgi:hypothetical protein
VAVNAFGNVIVTDATGVVWRIRPEELSAGPIAATADELDQVSADPGFRADWAMERLVDLARRHLGPPGEGRCYCLKIPGVLGGAYVPENLGTIELTELLEVSGDLARQIDNLPDGTEVRLRVKD